jgi:hypothetical protein
LLTQYPMTWLERRFACLWLKGRNWHSDSIFKQREVVVYDCCNMIRDEVARAPHMICMSLSKYCMSRMKVICTHLFIFITCTGTNLFLPLYRLHWYIKYTFP